MTTTPSPADFASLGLPESMLQTIKDVGYETPSPIQAQCIPLLLAGHDLLGQAQTGTGKTAAFALPLLARLDPNERTTQLLVLAPTRELAIQVAEACQTYARGMPGFRVLPIYGGASYTTQLKQLKAHPQLIVGTPGRVMDHLRRGTLKLDNLKALVLDEADEMLRMGFIDDVEWILEHTPSNRQTALFSATMPKQIQKVAERYLRDPQTIKIAGKTQTASAIKQRYWPVTGLHKLDALTRILEVETTDGVIVFVRTKIATTELAEKLSARGFSAEALNGDMAQAQREKTIDKMRNGKLDILIATDVAARGIDIARVSHVVNYDIPFDTESYVHRIGRTGRAGRVGEAILFVSNRERRMLAAIERATNQPIEMMRLPSEQDINTHRVERFKQQIDTALEQPDLDFFRKLLTEYQADREIDPLEIAAALAKIVQGDIPLLLSEKPTARERDAKPRRDRDGEGFGKEERSGREGRFSREDRFSKDDSYSKQGKPKKKRDTLLSTTAKPLKDNPDLAMQRYRIEVGYNDDVAPGHIVGAIANEADIESRFIGHIEIFDDYSVVDLPADMPKEVLQHLQKVWVCQRQLGIREITEPAGKAFRGNSRGNSRGGERKPEGRKFSERPAKDGSSKDKPFKDKSFKEKPFKEKSFKDKPFKDKPFSDSKGKEGGFKARKTSDAGESHFSKDGAGKISGAKHFAGKDKVERTAKDRSVKGASAPGKEREFKSKGYAAKDRNASDRPSGERKAFGAKKSAAGKFGADKPSGPSKRKS